MKKIDVIILAGGLGTRLRSRVSEVPKVLAPVNGVPFLDIVLTALVRSGVVGRIVIAAGYMAEKIIEHYTDCSCFGEITVSVESRPLGTGGAIKLALESISTQDVMVLNGDSFVTVDYVALYKAHKQRNAQLTMVLKHVENSNRYGSVSLDEHRITSFLEKDELTAPGLINAGVYLFNRKIFDHVKNDKIVSMERDLLPQIIKNDAFGFISEGKFIDIGLPETYEIANDYLMEG